MIYKPILPVDTLLKRLLLYGQIYSLRKRERHRSAAKVAEPDETKIINAVGRSPPPCWQAVFSCPQIIGVSRNVLPHLPRLWGTS